MIGLMPQEDQEAIRKAEETGNFEDPAYLRAIDHFMTLHCASVDENSPECVSRPKRAGKESYLYGWGPNEYVPTGSLGNFEYIDRLGALWTVTKTIAASWSPGWRNRTAGINQNWLAF